MQRLQTSALLSFVRVVALFYELLSPHKLHLQTITSNKTGYFELYRVIHSIQAFLFITY